MMTTLPWPPSASAWTPVEDYAEDDVPAAADPVPDGASEEADVVQRGLSEDA